MILNGWKEIAQHIGRGIRTVQRWEHIGLPVRRPQGNSRSAVIALSEELDAWVRQCPRESNPAPHPLSPELLFLQQTISKMRGLRQEQKKLRTAHASMIGRLLEAKDDLARKTLRLRNPHKTNA